MSLQPAQQVNVVVRVRHEAVAVTVRHSSERPDLLYCQQYPTGTCVTDEVRSSRNNVTSSCVEGGQGREVKAATLSIKGVGNQDGWYGQLR